MRTRNGRLTRTRSIDMARLEDELRKLIVALKMLTAEARRVAREGPAE